MDTTNSSPTVNNNQWVIQPGDIAARVEARELEGMLKRGIIINPGTNALLVDNGAIKDMLHPGIHNLDSLSRRLGDWINTGIGSQVSAWIVNLTPFDLEFGAGGIFTSDPIKVGVRIGIQAEVKEPGKFGVAILANRKSFTKQDLISYIYPEVSGLVDRWIAKHTVQELAEDLTLRASLELALAETLGLTFGKLGLGFLAVRAMEFNLEHLDRIKGIRSTYKLQVSEAEAKLEGEKNIFEVLRSGQVLEWAKETAKVEDEERRVELYKRMRDAVVAGKMNEVRSEADYETFLNGIDKEKLLREKERAELLQTWREAGEDHALARAFSVEKIKQEYSFQLEKNKIENDTNVAQIQVDSYIKIARQKADFEYEQKLKSTRQQITLDRELWGYEQEKARLKREQDELAAKMEFASQKEKTEFGLQVLEKIQRIRQINLKETLCIQSDNQIKLDSAKVDNEIRLWEIKEKSEQSKRADEIKKIQALTGVNPDDLMIGFSSPEVAAILAEKHMTPEQLMARAAAISPEVASLMAAKLSDVAKVKEAEVAREREINEQQKKDHEAELQRMMNMAEKNADRIQDTTKHNVDQMSAMGQAFAHNSGGTVVIPGATGGQVIHPNQPAPEPGQPAPSKRCKNCERVVQLDYRVCPFCGTKFPDVA